MPSYTLDVAGRKITVRTAQPASAEDIVATALNDPTTRRQLGPDGIVALGRAYGAVGNKPVAAEYEQLSAQPMLDPVRRAWVNAYRDVFVRSGLHDIITGKRRRPDGETYGFGFFKDKSLLVPQNPDYEALRTAASAAERSPWFGKELNATVTGRMSAELQQWQQQVAPALAQVEREKELGRMPLPQALLRTAELPQYALATLRATGATPSGVHGAAVGAASVGWQLLTDPVNLGLLVASALAPEALPSLASRVAAGAALRGGATAARAATIAGRAATAARAAESIGVGGYFALQSGTSAYRALQDFARSGDTIRLGEGLAHAAFAASMARSAAAGPHEAARTGAIEAERVLGREVLKDPAARDIELPYGPEEEGLTARIADVTRRNVRLTTQEGESITVPRHEAEAWLGDLYRRGMEDREAPTHRAEMQVDGETQAVLLRAREDGTYTALGRFGQVTDTAVPADVQAVPLHPLERGILSQRLRAARERLAHVEEVSREVRENEEIAGQPEAAAGVGREVPPAEVGPGEAGGEQPLGAGGMDRTPEVRGGEVPEAIRTGPEAPPEVTTPQEAEPHTTVAEVIHQTAERLRQAAEAQEAAVPPAQRGGREGGYVLTPDAIARMLAADALRVAAKGLDFTAWAAEKIQRFGEAVRPHLEEWWRRVQQAAEALRTRANAPETEALAAAEKAIDGTTLAPIDIQEGAGPTPEQITPGAEPQAAPEPVPLGRSVLHAMMRDAVRRLRAGETSPDAWTAETVATYGENVREHLPRVWEAARRVSESVAETGRARAAALSRAIGAEVRALRGTKPRAAPPARPRELEVVTRHGEVRRQWVSPDDPFLTGTRSDVQQLQLEERGSEPVARGYQGRPLIDPEVVRDANAALDGSLHAYDELAQEVARTRQMTPQQQLQLTVAAARYRKRMEEILEKPEDKLTAQDAAEIHDITERMDTIAEALIKAGTELSYMMNQRKVMVMQDMTLALLKRMPAVKRMPEAARRRLMQIMSRLDRSRQELEELEARRDRERAEEAASAERRLDEVVAEARSAAEASAERQATAGQSAEPRTPAERAVKAAMEEVGIPEEDFSDVEPLPLADEEAIAAVEARVKRLTEKVLPRLAQKVRPDRTEDFDPMYGMADMAAGYDFSDAVRYLARCLVQLALFRGERITSHGLYAMVRKAVRDAGINVSDRALLDAMGGYGRVTEPSQAVGAQTMRQIARLLRVVSAMRDAEKLGEVIPSGPKFAADVAQVMRHREALRLELERLGVRVTDEAEALRLALNRVRAKIARQEAQLASGRVSPRRRPRRIESPELDELRRRSAELEAQLETLRREQGAYDLEEVERLLKERMEYIRRVMASGVAPMRGRRRVRVADITDDEKLLELAAQKDELERQYRQWVKRMRDEASGYAEEAERLRGRIDAVTAEVNDLRARLEAGERRLPRRERRRREEQAAPTEQIAALREELKAAELQRRALQTQLAQLERMDALQAEIDALERGERPPEPQQRQTAERPEAERALVERRRELRRLARETARLEAELAGETRQRRTTRRWEPPSEEELAAMTPAERRYAEARAAVEELRRQQRLFQRMDMAWERRDAVAEAIREAIRTGNWGLLEPYRAREPRVLSETEFAIRQLHRERLELKREAQALLEIHSMSRARLIREYGTQLLRAWLQSWDLSAFGVQANPVVYLHPFLATRALAKSLGHMSRAAYYRYLADLDASPIADEARRMGVELTGLTTGITHFLREEGFALVGERLPGVAQSERAWTVYLDEVRVNLYALYKGIGQRYAGRELTDEELSAIARWVNTLTGRGKYADPLMAYSLSRWFWAPRLMKARFDLLNPAAWLRFPPFVRRIVLRDAILYHASTNAVRVLLHMAGFSVSSDPDDPRFLRPRRGNTDFDITGNMSSYTRFIARLFQYEVRVGQGAATRQAEDPLYQTARFLGGKLKPELGLAATLVRRQHITGEPATWQSIATNYLVPLAWQDVLDAAGQGRTVGEKAAIGAAVAVPAVLGFSPRTMEKGRRRRGRPLEVSLAPEEELAGVREGR